MKRYIGTNRQKIILVVIFVVFSILGFNLGYNIAKVVHKYRIEQAKTTIVY